MVMPNKQGKGSVQVCDGTQTLVSCIKATLSASRLTPTSTPSALDVCIAQLIRFSGKMHIFSGPLIVYQYIQKIQQPSPFIRRTAEQKQEGSTP